jgi:hypothetical protein
MVAFERLYPIRRRRCERAEENFAYDEPVRLERARVIDRRVAGEAARPHVAVAPGAPHSVFPVRLAAVGALRVGEAG